MAPFETVWASVTMSRGLFNKPKNPAYLEKVLKDLSLWDKRNSKIVQLSGGMKRRVLIAKALSHEPTILFLDEPTAGVDPEGRIAIRTVVSELRASGVCIVLTTHELGEAEKLADRIAIISRGRLVREGTPHQLTAGGPDAAAGGPSAGPVLTFGGPPGIDTAALARAVGPASRVVESSPGRYRVDAAPGIRAPAVTATVATFLAEQGATLTDLAVGKSLEDVYFETVGASADETHLSSVGPLDDAKEHRGPGGDRRRRRDRRARRGPAR